MININRSRFLIQFDEDINNFKKTHSNIHFKDFAGDLMYMKDIFYSTSNGHVWGKAEKLNKTYGNVLDWLYDIPKKPINFSSYFSRRTDAETAIDKFLSDKNKLEYIVMIEVNEYKPSIPYIPFGYYFDSFHNEIMIAILMAKINKSAEIDILSLNDFKQSDFLTINAINELNKILVS